MAGPLQYRLTCPTSAPLKPRTSWTREPRVAGRDPRSVLRDLQHPWDYHQQNLGPDPIVGSEPLRGTVDRWVEVLSDWALRLRFDVIVFWPEMETPQQVERFAREVAVGERASVPTPGATKSLLTPGPGSSQTCLPSRTAPVPLAEVGAPDDRCTAGGSQVTARCSPRVRPPRRGACVSSGRAGSQGTRAGTQRWRGCRTGPR